jgi:O-antigen ligase
MVVAAVVACLRQLSLRNIVLLIAVLSFTYAVIGLTAELVYGTFQPLSGDYRFAGTSHPNRQGMNIARGLLAVACLYSMRIPGRWLLIIVGLAGFVLLVLTKSRTATGAALIGLATFAALRLPPAKVALLIVTGATLGVLSIFLIQNQVMSTPLEIILMGRQHEAGATTLSGRTELWKILFGYAIERPIVGYGFHSFMSPEWVSQLSVQARWFGGEAHSLYIEILLGTGFVGLALFVTALLGSCARGFRWVTKSRDPALAFLVAYLVFVVFNGFLTAITIYPDPKFVGVLVLGYVLFRDPERDAAAAGAVPDAYSGQFSVPPHSGGTPGVPDWPPVHGAGVPPHFPRR